MRYQITFSTGKTCEVGPDVRGGIVQAMKVGASVMERSCPKAWCTSLSPSAGCTVSR